MRSLRDLVQCLIDNDPEDIAADGGVRVIDVWRKEAEAALRSTGDAKPTGDAKRLDWLEKRARKSPTGISFDWVPACDDERSGWRYMHRHFISEQKSSLRNAIDGAMKEHP
jgi:hypothetical protein